MAEQSTQQYDLVHDLSPPLETYREMARQAAMMHFIAIALRDRRPDTQRAMDAVKAGEARMMLVPGSTYVSDFLRREAEIRSVYLPQAITALDLAKMVDSEADKLKKIELARVEVSLGIDAAQNVVTIAAILTQFGISLPGPELTPDQRLPVGGG